jgi:hypothetical protein
MIGSPYGFALFEVVEGFLWSKGVGFSPPRR